jgi:peptidyl-prolyl cis-trans isomerase D
VQISDEELRKEFDSLKPENRAAGVRVQQIVLKVATKELETEVLNKATELVAGIRGEDLKATEEKFAELARGRSEDPATAKQGGWLPRPVKKDPNKTGDIYQNAVDMPPGQVSDPFFDKGSSAYYIFRRGDQVDKTFEEAKQEMLVSLRNRRGYAAAAQLAQRVAERLKETKNHEQVAREFAAEANMSPAEMVRETGFVKPGDEVKDIGSSPQFEEAIAPLTNAQDVGDRVSIRDGFAVPMLLEKREPRVPELSEVREEVAEKVKAEKSKAQVEQAARELAAASSPDELKAVADRLGIRAQEAKEYTLGTPLGVAGTSGAADEAIYALRSGGVTKTPIKVGETYVVVAVKNRTDADLAKFGAERDKLMQDALEERRMQVYDDYMTSVRARLEREGEINVYEDVLAKLAASEVPPVAAPRAPRGGTSAPVPVVPE